MKQRMYKLQYWDAANTKRVSKMSFKNKNAAWQWLYSQRYMVLSVKYLGWN